ncbi:MAG: sulfite exporter TauE/SafE family protein [Candidatus Promineifilaceae bacterium]|nr:sulfite exporter TauE/SafE family protein [Candidatus Promineifilaceae bacterium]
MLVSLIIFFATFVQSSVGFGLALIAMPLLVALLGIRTAAPLVAIVAFAAEFAILVRYRHALNLRAVLPLTITAIVAIPVGVFALRNLDEALVTTALGIFLILYSFYALFSPHVPELAHSWWAYLFGFLAGTLGGAYNTSGPPVIVYGNCRRWPPEEFKSNLQGFFVVFGLFVIAVHAFSGNFTGDVWSNLLLSLPGIFLGLVAGFALSRLINADLFRKLVLVLLIILGTMLIIG